MILTPAVAVLNFATIFLSLVTALPTLPGHTAVLASRHTCRPLIKLPIHWDPHATHQEIKIVLNEALSRSLSCTYTVVDGWNGTPARVRIPMPGLDDDEMKTYKGHLKISEELGKILAQTELDDGVSAVVLDVTPFPGKVIWKTKWWLYFFSKDTRAAPSYSSARECKQLLKNIYQEVFDMMVYYAEAKGLVYNLNTFNFRTSVLWSDDSEQWELVNWHPTLTGHLELPAHIPKAMKDAWLQKIATKDLLPAEAIYRNSMTREDEDVRGWCEYFNVNASQDQVFSYGHDDEI